MCELFDFVYIVVTCRLSRKDGKTLFEIQRPEDIPCVLSGHWRAIHPKVQCPLMTTILSRTTTSRRSRDIEPPSRPSFFNVLLLENILTDYDTLKELTLHLFLHLQKPSHTTSLPHPLSLTVLSRITSRRGQDIDPSSHPSFSNASWGGPYSRITTPRRSRPFISSFVFKSLAVLPVYHIQKELTIHLFLHIPMPLLEDERTLSNYNIHPHCSCFQATVTGMDQHPCSRFFDFQPVQTLIYISFISKQQESTFLSFSTSRLCFFPMYGYQPTRRVLHPSRLLFLVYKQWGWCQALL